MNERSAVQGLLHSTQRTDGESVSWMLHYITDYAQQYDFVSSLRC
jgi:hypothetical protein